VSIEKSINIQFTPNKRYDCELYKNDLRIFKGKFKLNEVKILEGNYSFDCNLISDAVDIFAKLKDKKLNELDWSEYDHLLTRDNVIKSWSEGIKLNGVDNRNFGSDSRGYQPKSYGYIYPIVDYGYVKPKNNSPLNFKVNQLYPFIYVKEAVKKCLDFALEGTNIEVDYTTTFFNNENMKKLIYGFGGGEQNKLNSTQVSQSQVLINNATNNSVYQSKNIGYYFFADQFNVLDQFSFTPTYDANILNQNTGRIKMNIPGKYKLSFSTESVYYTSAIGYNPITFDTFNEVIVYVDGLQVYRYKWKQLVDVITTISFNTNIDVKAGQEVYLELVFAGGCSSGNSTGYQSFALSFNNTDINLIADNSIALTDNSPVSLSSSLPDIKCSDFLKGILNLFYAYMSDPIYDPVTNKSLLTINSFINFYDSQENYDNWTDLVDESKDITIQSNSLVQGNVYQYMFSEEKDYLNTQYRDLIGINYGERQLEINTWLNGVVKFELPFNTYVPYKIENSQLIYPLVIEQTTDSNNVPVTKPYKGKGMLTFYNGLRSGVVNIYDVEDAGGTFTIKYDFPMIHHLRFKDHPTNFYSFEPLFDLHFAPRSTTFDDIYAVPENSNTFEIYHRKFVNEITSIDSKLVTLYLKLNYKDINELDFAKLKMIDGVLYRLNTIKDFDSDAYGTTEVELIKYLG
jgi:hypothetical protein